MSYSDITPGTKAAEFVAARFIKSEKGTLGVEVKFRFAEGAGYESLSWNGWLSPAAIENTMRTMVDVLGFNGDDSVDANSLLRETAFARDRKFDIVIEMETYEGKTRPRIKWVNLQGTGGQFKALSPETVRNELGAVGFRAAYLSASAGMKKSAPTAREEALPF